MLSNAWRLKKNSMSHGGERFLPFAEVAVLARRLGQQYPQLGDLFPVWHKLQLCMYEDVGVCFAIFKEPVRKLRFFRWSVWHDNCFIFLWKNIYLPLETYLCHVIGTIFPWFVFIVINCMHKKVKVIRTNDVLRQF